uniref:Single domain-containing protein n=1 Tax=Amblyomma cajennense TaxID=34607 RepID=A0A023FQU0_AMBCJ
MSKVTKLLLLTVALTGCIALSEEKKKVSSLKFVNGTCHFRGRIIEDGDYEYPNDTCEEWKCDAANYRLKVTGCDIGTRYSSCIHKTRKGTYWTWCCRLYQPYC